MGAEEASSWVFAGKWHYLQEATQHTWCGIPVPEETEQVAASVVLADIRENRTSVCGACERHQEAAAPIPPSAEEANKNLTQEQQEIRAKLEGESARRVKARAAEELDRKSRSTSRGPHTVPGGLPGLGKRK